MIISQKKTFKVFCSTQTTTAKAITTTTTKELILRFIKFLQNILIGRK